uniref:Si:ch211-114c12.5 n=1 Tax=Lepisosteus oculatus TaxID=7918 RepID=W5N8X7_LEPOC
QLKMKSILKVQMEGSPVLDRELPSQSHTICAVRWKLPEEEVQVHSSVPTSAPFKSKKLPNGRQQSLSDLRSLEECVNFITQWAEQVDHVCKRGSRAREDPGEGTSRGPPGPAQDGGPLASPRTGRSLEECRRLILEWADELNSVAQLSKPRRLSNKTEEQADRSEGETDDPSEKEKQRIMEWARELKTMSENCGLPGEELTQMLHLLGLRKRRLVSVLPFLEFITWSLLKDDAKGTVPQLWLSTKQRTWKAGTPRYIPNSVWSWICRAAADVTLDPQTVHPWLVLSDDLRKVQEGRKELNLPSSPQRFDGWPCVLGWEGFSSGRHYWEVDLANNGYWRIGVTTASSERKGRFPMNPAQGYWTLWRSTRQFWACTKPETPLPVSLVPRKVGVYLDYEEGQVSFYNVESRSHIYTFTDTFKEKLYPLFAPLDGRTLITVSSPNTITEF